MANNRFQSIMKHLLRIQDSPKVAEVENRRKPTVTVPRGRQSKINTGGNPATFLKQQVNYVSPKFALNCIPVIRDMYKVNEDMGLALMDIVQLTNTGHHIRFDQDMDADTQNKMRKHLQKVSQNWMDGVSGVDGIASRLIAQLWVGGAISAENVVNMNMRGIERVALVNPELIRYAIEKGRYQPYQIVNHLDSVNSSIEKSGYVKLNTNTYHYEGLLTDEEVPYGVPPFLASLKSLARQDKMNTNIDAVLEMLGVLGFLQVSLDKPDQEGTENVAAYKARLTALLEETKENVLTGFKQGISVGYKDDLEYDFHPTTSNVQGLDILVKNGKQQVANGLKHNVSFLGEGSSSETALSIVFTKMLSQLNNVQTIVSNYLCALYDLELRLAGFRPRGLKVEFKPSTITDDLKYQQAKEIKIRNLQALYDQGIIGQDQFAEESGYDKANKPKPRVTRDTNVMAPGSKKEDRNRKQAKSDRGSRSKKKDQPKRKDNKNE